MPTPHFHDLPDGTTSINHTGEDSWVVIDEAFLARPPEEAFRSHAAALPPPLPAPIRPAPIRPAPIRPSPHPSYADGSAQLMPPPTSRPPVNFEITENPFIFPAPPPTPTPLVANGVNNTAIGVSAMAHNISGTHTERRSRSTRLRRGSSDPDAATRKDPNAWSLREAVELCKLLEVVLPEAGFHIALTGGLLYREGRRKDCDLMFYQIRGTEPNYEVLWKYLTVAGVIRSPSYPENGWLVKATYRGKAIDCLFPNAKKVKKVTMGELSTKQNAYQATSPTPATPPEGCVVNVVDPNWEAGAPILVRHNDGAPILYRRSPCSPLAYDHTREATPYELTAMEFYLRERREQREPDTRSNAEIIDAAVAAYRMAGLDRAVAAPVPALTSIRSSEEMARELGMSVREFERQYE